MLMCVCHMFIKVLTYLLIKVVLMDCKSLVAKQLDDNQFALSLANSFAFAVGYDYCLSHKIGSQMQDQRLTSSQWAVRGYSV